MSRQTTLSKSDVKKARKQLRAARKNASTTVAPIAADAREATVRAADATRDWAAPRVESAVDWAAPRVSTARDWAAPRVDTAKDWAAPRVEPAVEKVKSDVLPAVTGAIATALAATEPQRHEIADRSAAALAALRGEVPAPSRKKRHRVRKAFLLAGVLGAAWAGWKAWIARTQDPVDAWTTPAPTPVTCQRAGGREQRHRGRCAGADRRRGRCGTGRGRG